MARRNKRGYLTADELRSGEVESTGWVVGKRQHAVEIRANGRRFMVRRGESRLGDPIAEWEETLHQYIEDARKQYRQLVDASRPK